jgi:hypothetical protein
MDKRRYFAPQVDILALGEALETWYREKGFETQFLSGTDGSVAVQAQKAGLGRQVVGMATALTCVFMKEGEYVEFEIGKASWVDKAAASVIGLALWGATLITAGVGVYEQGRLKANTLKFIEEYIDFGSERAIGMAHRLRADTIPSQVNTAADIVCPSCGKQNALDARFCEYCGALIS